MFTKKEITWIIIAVIIFTFIISLGFPENYNPLLLLIPLIIILTSVISKKIASKFYSIEIEHKIWEFKRWGFYERSKFKKPIPIGLILPFFLSLLSLGTIKMLIFLQFEAKNISEKRILKKQGGIRRFKRIEMNELDCAMTAAWGFYALLALAIIGLIIKVPELTKYSIYYTLWNLIPISNLDGAKLFFGSSLSWAFITIVYIIFLLGIIVF